VLLNAKQTLLITGEARSRSRLPYLFDRTDARSDLPASVRPEAAKRILELILSNVAGSCCAIRACMKLSKREPGW